MKSNVVMDSVDRELCGLNVRQRTKDEYLCLLDVLNVVDKSREERAVTLNQRYTPIDFRFWVKQKNISEFIEELELDCKQKAYTTYSKQLPGWIHPLLALKMLTHFNPRFELRVYKWFYDYLIRNRLHAGDMYNLMNGVSYSNYPNKQKYPSFIAKVNSRINSRIGITSRQTATQEQLNDLAELQKSIADMTKSYRDSERGVEEGFEVFNNYRMESKNDKLRD